jgi:hypothetical protein
MCGACTDELVPSCQPSETVVLVLLLRQVSADIKKLSKVKPKLPWSASDTNVKKAKPAAKAGGKPAGFGAKR